MTDWVLVPREPTEEMILAFAETWFKKRRCIDDPEFDDAYAALIQAAPTHDAAGGEKCPACEIGTLWAHVSCRCVECKATIVMPDQSRQNKRNHDAAMSASKGAK